MTALENKQFVLEYLEALSGKPKTEAVIAKYVTDAFLQQHILDFEAAFPNYTGNVEDIVAEDDLVAIRATFSGTQRNDFMGIPAGGRQVSFGAMVFYRVKDRKIVEAWLQADMVGLMQQLGATPAGI
jgi:predicted ester cyclase